MLSSRNKCPLTVSSSWRRLTARRWLSSASSAESTSDDTQHEYPNLFEPLTLDSGVVLPNRVLMGSMHTGLEGNSIPGVGLWALGEERHDLSAMAEYFRERAQGGVGLMVTGGIAPNWAGWVGEYKREDCLNRT